VNVLGDNAEAGLECLHALVPPLKKIPNLFGFTASCQLEKMLRNTDSSHSAALPAAEYTIRFLTLLVQKNCFNHIDTIMQKIENIIDNKKGILPVLVETAAGDVPEKELKRRIMETTGALNVKMKINHVPELLGGYRLRIGGYYVDASLKGQIEKMKADLGRL
jgi:F-type H+-transporting ATPase subunit delta